MDSPLGTLKPTPDLALEQARNARARAWAYVFDCFHRRNGKEGGPAITAPDNDATKGERR
jgi:hypothetical protein